MRRGPFIIGGIAVVFLAILLVWASSGSNANPGNLTEVSDKAALQNQTQLAHISIATGENYFGNRFRVISGVVTNTSGKPLKRIDVKMTFQDMNGNSIQESVHHAYESLTKPLEPGAQHRFEVNFENLPKGWNYRIPVVEVVKIGY